MFSCLGLNQWTEWPSWSSWSSSSSSLTLGQNAKTKEYLSLIANSMDSQPYEIPEDKKQSVFEYVKDHVKLITTWKVSSNPNIIIEKKLPTFSIKITSIHPEKIDRNSPLYFDFSIDMDTNGKLGEYRIFVNTVRYMNFLALTEKKKSLSFKYGDVSVYKPGRRIWKSLTVNYNYHIHRFEYLINGESLKVVDLAQSRKVYGGEKQVLYLFRKQDMDVNGHYAFIQGVQNDNTITLFPIFIQVAEQTVFIHSGLAYEENSEKMTKYVSKSHKKGCLITLNPIKFHVVHPSIKVDDFENFRLTIAENSESESESEEEQEKEEEEKKDNKVSMVFTSQNELKDLKDLKDQLDQVQKYQKVNCSASRMERKQARGDEKFRVAVPMAVSQKEVSFVNMFKDLWKGIRSRHTLNDNFQSPFVVSDVGIDSVYYTQV